MYRLATIEEIVSVTGTINEDIVDSWLLTKAKVFMKDGEPYGLVSVVESEDNPEAVFVASTVTDPSNPFTFAMLRYILRLADDYTIICITDEPEYQDLIMRALDGHGFHFRVLDNVLYSTKEKLRKGA